MKRQPLALCDSASHDFHSASRALVELTGHGVRAMCAANVAYDELLETYFAPTPTRKRVALGSALGLLRARATP